MRDRKKKALVSGSLVFDTLFTLTSAIRDQINVSGNKISKLNLMFAAEAKQVFYGGTAGNIAYGLGLLKETPFVVSVVGKDFGEYATHLNRHGIEPRIYIDNDGHTATFYCMDDTNGEQIGIFQGNAYHKHIDTISLQKALKVSDWKEIAIGIFSPGTARSMLAELKEFRKNAPKESLSIFDPGQMLAIDFTPELFSEGLRHADMLIVNDTELLHIKKKFGLSMEQIFDLGVAYVIETKGADGSVLHMPESEIAVKAFKIKKMIDPTGAGDAYRAGLIHGILSDLSIPDAMRLGSKLGALCVQNRGGQTYKL